MKRSEDYKGHVIEAEAREVKPGRWTWSYVIDGEHYQAGGDRPLQSEDLMIDEALESARRRIDAMA
jgi:hypothetical protein